MVSTTLSERIKCVYNMYWRRSNKQMLFSTSSIYFLLLRLNLFFFSFEINAAIVRFVPNNLKLNARHFLENSMQPQKTIKRYKFIIYLLVLNFKNNLKFKMKYVRRVSGNRSRIEIWMSESANTRRAHERYMSNSAMSCDGRIHPYSILEITINWYSDLLKKKKTIPSAK